MSHPYRQKRLRALWQTAGATAAAKACAVSCLFIQVPIALHYLGADAFGVWTVLTGALALGGIADLGLGAGAQNRVAHAMGSEDAAESYRLAWTALLLLAGIGIVAAAVMVPLCFLLDWHFLFHGVSPALFAQIPHSLLIVILCWLVGLPLGLAPRLALAFQIGWLGAIGSALSAGLVLASVGAAVFLHWQLTTLIFFTSISPAVANGITLFWLLLLHPGMLRQRPDLTRRSLRSLFVSGFWFFPPTVGSILFTSMPPLIVSAVIGPAAVVVYQLLQRLASLFTQVESLVMTPLWPAYTEAHARGDVDWIRHTFRLSLLGVAFLFALPLLSLPLWASPAIRLWTGYAAPLPQATLICFALLSAAGALGQPVAVFLNGLGHLLSQVLFGFSSVVLGLLIMPALTRHFGLTGTFLAMGAPYIFLNLSATTGEALYRLRRLTASSA